MNNRPIAHRECNKCTIHDLRLTPLVCSIRPLVISALAVQVDLSAESGSDKPCSSILV